MAYKHSNINGFVLITTIILFIISQFNHDLFHFVTEMLTIFIGIMIFIMAINSKVYSERSVLLSLGITYLYIGTLDFLHVISIENVDIIKTTVFSSQSYWMAARLLESANILIIFYLYRKIHKTKYALSHISHLAYISIAFFIIYIDVLPTRFFTGTNFFNIGIELIIIALYIGGLYFATKIPLSKEHKRILLISISLKIVSEVLMLIRFDNTLVFMDISIILKFLSYTGFYIVFVYETIKRPYHNVHSIFQVRQAELLELSETDQLTGVYNHSVTYQKLEALVEKYKNSNQQFFVTMIDIDDFKVVNDTYGHQKGDEVLVEFANLLRSRNYPDHIVGRYGGDEFIIAGLYTKDLDIKEGFKDFNVLLKEMCQKLGVQVTFSAGSVIYSKGDSAKDLVYKADIKMYESKRLGKNRVTIWKSE